jgi:hypothetical protein
MQVCVCVSQKLGSRRGGWSGLRHINTTAGIRPIKYFSQDQTSLPAGKKSPCPGCTRIHLHRTARTRPTCIPYQPSYRTGKRVKELGGNRSSEQETGCQTAESKRQMVGSKRQVMLTDKMNRLEQEIRSSAAGNKRQVA